MKNLCTNNPLQFWDDREVDLVCKGNISLCVCMVIQQTCIDALQCAVLYEKVALLLSSCRCSSYYVNFSLSFTSGM